MKRETDCRRGRRGIGVVVRAQVNSGMYRRTPPSSAAFPDQDLEPACRRSGTVCAARQGSSPSVHSKTPAQIAWRFHLILVASLRLGGRRVTGLGREAAHANDQGVRRLLRLGAVPITSSPVGTARLRCSVPPAAPAATPWPFAVSLTVDLCSRFQKYHAGHQRHREAASHERPSTSLRRLRCLGSRGATRAGSNPAFRTRLLLASVCTSCGSVVYEDGLAFGGLEPPSSWKD